MKEWQPIETAPKDGTRVIVSKIGKTHDTQGHGIYSDEYRRIIFEEEPTIVSVWFACTARYIAGQSYWSDGIEKLVTPTHWMPLPKPPEQS